ncbi:hypothetical protein OK015_28925 (plasmid) [Mycobacterium sp. Aquia_216]|uniref:hypothetical protein n=1 Tax=Mycobacterium sp. Aquia_216 TaxID=2991729 RepID=UPI002279F837|nr:hypothetical protein [Mycobacterium sp. Aquia_216]WAJ47973.1 hypothetical protein OK015_28925 [Mycobacterium sp. Aquia_216]
MIKPARDPRRRCHQLRRRLRHWPPSLLGGLALATFALAGPAVAQAHSATISPGDEIDTVQAPGGTRCTLGYTFTDPGTNINYGITAGHCNKGHGDNVVDRTTGAGGHFILTVATAGDNLQDDYGLVDFGSNHSVRTMYGMPVSGISTPDPHAAVCHDGIRTGIACGSLDGRLIASQYLTTGMAQSIPGDSGGPVWQLAHDNAGTASVIGIWLGEHIEPNGAHYGRFISLTDVLVNVAAKTHVL